MAMLWGMVRKDLVRQVRSPMAVGFVLIFPVVFSGLLALTFGGGGDRIPRARLLVEDQDGSVLSEMLLKVTQSEQVAKFFDIRPVGADGIDLLESEEAAALLRIPPDFGAKLLEGTPVELELYRNPAQSIMPEVAEQGLVVLAEALDAASWAFREPLATIGEMISPDGAAPSAAEVAVVAGSIYTVFDGAQGLVMPPAITLTTVQLEEEGAEASTKPSSSTSAIFLLVLPGISVWSLFLLGDMSMRDILVEAKLGTLRRQLTSPMHSRQIVIGKVLYTFAVSVISLILLAIVGYAFTRQIADPLGFVVLSFAVVFAVTGYAAVVYGMAGTERQGATISSMVLLLFAFIGGSFIPLDSLPASVRQFSPLSPFYWGTAGYTELLLDGGGLIQVLPNVGVLAAIGAVLLVAGSWLLGRKVLRGAAQ